MIDVEYNLMLREIKGRSRERVDIGAGEITLAALEALLGLTDDDVGMLFVNGAWRPLDCVIPDGAAVQLFPDTEGG